MGEKGNRTRDIIREKSFRLFADKGFSAVTMKDICEACGLSRGGLYRHYSSTQEVFEEILHEMSEKDDEFIVKDVAHKESAKDILEKELHKMQQEMMESHKTLSYAIYEYSNVCSASFMAELNQSTRKKWKRLLEYGMARGEFRHVNAGQMADMILYVYQGVRMWSRVIPMEQKTVNNIIEKIKKDLER